MITSMYLHIPFCKDICSYCDFCKFLYNEQFVLAYLETLKKEIDSYYKHEELQTLYIGGGTPSTLSLTELTVLFSFVDSILLRCDYEFTFECNIEDITEELLRFLSSHRVNRLSIGVQTVNQKHLTFLNRHHTKKQVVEKVDMAKQMGFTNINLDFMYAFPSETIEEVEEDLQFFVSLDVPHISMYSLILEDHTKLAIQKVKRISEDIDFMMYERITHYLEKQGYRHYEVSNFSKPGFCSKHNLTYWNNLEYYGFGLGSAGYIGDIRYSNTRSLNHYLQGFFHLEEDKLSKEEMMSNEMILGLRKMEGVSKKKFYQKYGKQIFEQYDIMELIENHLLEENEEYLFIPREHIYISNQILLHFI